MLSHDTRLRCELVDLYYTLYGTRRPTCLPVPELAAMMNIQRGEMKKMKSFASIKQLSASSEKQRNLSPLPHKDVQQNDIIIDSNLDNLNVSEVVVKEERIKVRL